ncbi:c2H2-type domain-containing protein [Trichonephila clavata]|uniref:C2H2-type domain-containing protein n=1 Tax=Trichonephila clavata TaxID=2740835 RepID=A0A8X6G0N4_TRICU|nr:c2H2-type domain-containing protein [Trichonephila clavata]
MLYHPFCIFADFESLTEKVSGTLPSATTSFTADLERHKAVSYSIIATDAEDKLIFHEFYVGENAIANFFETLTYLSDRLMKKMHRIMPLVPRPDDCYDPLICHICKKKFLPGEIRVRDHAHWGIGRINGLAHQVYSDYDHALTVFEAFECQTFSDYLEIYQNVDVIMLAEIFLSFRRTSMQSYHLDPVHFITSAQLTWNAGLKISKVELQLLGDVNEYLWFEKSMRGGVCLLGRRHAIANNLYIAENYNKKLPSNYILALDAKNLYGFAISQFLPVGNFRWLDSEQLSKFNVMELDKDSDIGYILEVDLLYPKHLHNKHNDLPLAPEHVLITYDMLSSYSKELCDEFGLKSTLPSKKLTPNFFSPKNYVTH